MRRKFNHEVVFKCVLNTIYIASGIIMLVMIINNVKASVEIDAETSATYIDCMNCDEID